MTDYERRMNAVDRLSPAMRELVYEYGFIIVREMIADGHRDAEKLRPLLEGWRMRRQAEWAAEIPYARVA